MSNQVIWKMTDRLFEMTNLLETLNLWNIGVVFFKILRASKTRGLAWLWRCQARGPFRADSTDMIFKGLITNGRSSSKYWLVILQSTCHIALFMWYCLVIKQVELFLTGTIIYKGNCLSGFIPLNPCICILYWLLFWEKNMLKNVSRIIL